MKYLSICSLHTKNNQTVSLYVPLPVFVGGKWLLGEALVPRFAVFCRKLQTFADHRRKCRIVPYSADFCRLLLISSPELLLPFP